MKTPSSSLDQVKTIFGFINRLQFKDEIAADAAETTESAMESANYIAACLRSDTNTEEVRKIIIDSYVEKNKYYKALLDDYGVNPFVADLLAGQHRLLEGALAKAADAHFLITAVRLGLDRPANK